jgi:septal ring factor EnvC (AmiA/AmiB activator)
MSQNIEVVALLELIVQQLRNVERKLDHMAETQDQEAADLNALTTQVGQVQQGIVQLEAALASAGQTSPAVDAALATLKAAVAGAQAALPQTPPATP